MFRWGCLLLFGWVVVFADITDVSRAIVLSGHVMVFQLLLTLLGDHYYGGWAHDLWSLEDEVGIMIRAWISWGLLATPFHLRETCLGLLLFSVACW